MFMRNKFCFFLSFMIIALGVVAMVIHPYSYLQSGEVERCSIADMSFTTEENIEGADLVALLGSISPKGEGDIHRIYPWSAQATPEYHIVITSKSGKKIRLGCYKYSHIVRDFTNNVFWYASDRKSAESLLDKYR